MPGVVDVVHGEEHRPVRIDDGPAEEHFFPTIAVQIEGPQNVGVVMYYGMPVRDVEKLKTLNSDVLGLFATEQYISKEIIEDFAAKMKEAGKKLDYKIFPGVHGFANPSNPKYDQAQAAEAYGMALGYLKKRLGA